ncbi:hypothetical protein [Cryobacterium arcticum]|uniref:Putative integral membrane protein n=1 Tax=Cryobacterium arcticum TaxID=670052 RepID=A0A1B1BN02_9MICO|nr:hypothetical protein [Cryobacterium arcticum]ANP73944.1 Putative integral membrane protein [Cryobacterium arcticum]
MTDTTPPEGNKNNNPDAPTTPIHDDQSPEPTTVADPSKSVDETVNEPHVEPATETSATEPAPYVPGEPIDYEPAPYTAADSDAPTEKVERLTAEPEATPAEVARDEAVAQQKDYTPAYVPTPAAAGQPLVQQPSAQQPSAEQYTPTQQFAPTPVYVTAPTPPKTAGNRAAGILIGLIATAVFAVVYAVVAFVISASSAPTVAEATARFTDFLVLPVFYIPVIFFFLAFALLVAVLNRAGWWAYVLGGFLVAVVVYFSYIGGALLAVQAWNLTPAEAGRFVTTQWLNPGAIAAAIVAREVPIWFGAWIARRGRSVTAKNAAAKAEYERQLAEGPQLARPA